MGIQTEIPALPGASLCLDTRATHAAFSWRQGLTTTALCGSYVWAQMTHRQHDKEEVMTYESFAKALKAFFNIESSTMIREFKALTDQDKVDLSTMLNAEGFTHPQYEPKAA